MDDRVNLKEFLDVGLYWRYAEVLKRESSETTACTPTAECVYPPPIGVKGRRASLGGQQLISRYPVRQC